MGGDGAFGDTDSRPGPGVSAAVTATGNGESSRRRVAIAGSGLFQDGVAALLTEPGKQRGAAMTVCTVQELQSTVSRESADLVIVELPPSDSGECDVLVSLARLPRPPRILLVCQTWCPPDRILRGIRAGADACVSFAGGASQLRTAFDAIQVGDRYIGPLITAAIFQHGVPRTDEPRAQSGGLVTPREAEVLELLAEGLTGPQVAEKLTVSPRTIHVHRTRLMRKLQVHNVTQLLRRALELRLVKLS
jgi:DNA-binding NarL/FixJ family response regulator